MRYFDRAALFVEACLKYGALEVSEDTDILCPMVTLRRGMGREWGLGFLLIVLLGLYWQRSIF